MAKLFKTFDYGTTPNAFDWLKAIALLTMIIDHLGNYFWPEVDAFRAVGRIAFPIFLFLVGYSHNFRFNPYLLGGAILVTLSAALTHHPVFPLNILWSILIYRAVMAKVKETQMFQNELGMLWFALLIFFMPTAFFSEYGTESLMFLILGFMAREGRQDAPAKRFALATFGLWVLEQSVTFNFDTKHILAFALIATVEAWLIHRHFWETQPQLSTKESPSTPTLGGKLVILLARNTLVLYVLHVALFQILALNLFPERHAEPGIVWMKTPEK